MCDAPSPWPSASSHRSHLRGVCSGAVLTHWGAASTAAFWLTDGTLATHPTLASNKHLYQPPSATLGSTQSCKAASQRHVWMQTDGRGRIGSREAWCARWVEVGRKWVGRGTRGRRGARRCAEVRRGGQRWKRWAEVEEEWWGWGWGKGRRPAATPAQRLTQCPQPQQGAPTA